MKPATRLMFALSLLSAPCFAARWSGILVDSACYEFQEKNSPPTGNLGSLTSSRFLELRNCRPTLHTKSFMVVQAGGVEFKLDAAGNAKASEIVRNVSQPDFAVTITGTRDNTMIRVESIFLVRNEPPHK